MSIFDISLVLSATLCALVAGFLFCYAVVIMPGIKNLDDKMFLKSFQVTDRIIQNNQPLFMLVWLGSAVALIICTMLAFSHLQGAQLVLLVLAAAAYLLGVQVTTVAVHLPLNNKLQQLDLESMDQQETRSARGEFEQPWNRSNQRRTVIACAVAAVLVALPLIQ